MPKSYTHGPSFFRLTANEKHVLTLLEQGKSVKEIAAEKGVKPNTVYSQITTARSKMKVILQMDARPENTQTTVWKAHGKTNAWERFRNSQTDSKI